MVGKLLLVLSLLLGPSAGAQPDSKDVPSAANITVIFWSADNQGIEPGWLQACKLPNCQGQ